MVIGLIIILGTGLGRIASDTGAAQTLVRALLRRVGVDSPLRIQIDWFGPFPNADMIGQMGLARSSNLRMMLFNGWAIMGANLVLFAVPFAVL